MTQTLMVHIPGTLYDQLKRIAELSHRPVDTIIAQSLHALRGSLSGFHVVNVSGNWRIVFRFEDGDAFDVDYLDYH